MKQLLGNAPRMGASAMCCSLVPFGVGSGSGLGCDAPFLFGRYRTMDANRHMIRFNCPHCEKSIRVKGEAAGRKGKCPGCGQTVRVPVAPQPAEPQRPPKPLEILGRVDIPVVRNSRKWYHVAVSLCSRRSEMKRRHELSDEQWAQMEPLLQAVTVIPESRERTIEGLSMR